MLTVEQIEQFRRSGFVNGGPVLDDAVIETLPEGGAIGIKVPDFPMEFANIYIREL